MSYIIEISLDSDPQHSLKTSTMVIEQAGLFSTKGTIIMTDNQPWDKQDKNTEPMTTVPPYAPASTSMGASSARENAPTVLPVEGASGVNDTVIGAGVATKGMSDRANAQPAAHPADKAMSTGLSRALMGGLIGATLGTLVGALANKRTAEGVNHAAKGVGVAVKSVAEGVNHATKGVGVAVKSVAEGVNHAVVGRAVEAVKDTSEGVKQSVTGAVEAVKGAAEETKQSVTGAVEAVKGASDVKPFDNQSFKPDQQLVAGKQATTSSVGTGQDKNPAADVPVLVEEEGLVVIAMPVEAETPLDSSEAGFLRG